MNDVQTHYETLLAPLYAWSMGGRDAAISAMTAFLDGLPLPPAPAEVLDLGAGFGAAALALARRGHHVVAVDSSATLLAELAAAEPHLRIRTVAEDLVAFVQAGKMPADLLLCLGDTLAHLPSQDAVTALLQGMARTLRPGGLAVLSYRPKAHLTPAQRFLLVRADVTRSLTCFLEPIDEGHQTVWDIVHEHVDGDTTLRVSGYRKLRLEPAWVAQEAQAAGLRVETLAPWRGMTVQVLRPTDEA